MDNTNCIYNPVIGSRALTLEEQADKDVYYKKLSEHMKGSGNPNYGKERSEEHCTKMSIGVALAKHAQRTISDERILEIRAYYDEQIAKNPHYTFTALRKHFGYESKHRDLISQIVKREYLVLTEIMDGETKNEHVKKRIAKKNGGVDNSNRKRNLKPEDSIKVVQYLIDHPELKSKQKQILEDLDDIPKLTLSVVKNYQKGVIQVFEDDFPIDDMPYDDFLDMKEKLAAIMQK